MKKSEIQKLKSGQEKELTKELQEARESLRSLKFELASGKVKNMQLVRETKKKIARILTFVNTRHE